MRLAQLESSQENRAHWEVQIETIRYTELVPQVLGADRAETKMSTRKKQRLPLELKEEHRCVSRKGSTEWGTRGGR